MSRTLSPGLGASAAKARRPSGASCSSNGSRTSAHAATRTSSWGSRLIWSMLRQCPTVAVAVQLFLTRIVRRVDVIDAPRSDELDLENCLLGSGPSVMRVFCRVYPQRARLQHLAVVFKLLAMAGPGRTAN